MEYMQESMLRNIEGPPLEQPIVSAGLGERYFASMDQYKDKLHQIDAVTGVTETKNSVRCRAIKVAIEMRNRGVKEGQVVLICSKTHLDQTVALLACLFLGAIVAPIHVDLPYDEFARLLGILQPKLAFCGNRSARLLQRVFKEKNIKCWIFTFGGDGKDFLEFNKCLENQEDPNFQPTVIKDPKRTIAFVLATHGTEHEPKLVAFSHYSILMRYLYLIESRIKKTEKLLTFFPLSWSAQVVVSCICFDTQSRIIFAGSFTERGACKFIHDLRIEIVFLDGNFATKIVKNAPIQDFDLSCLKLIYIGGMHLIQTNFTKIAKTFKGVTIINAYSTIETGIISTLSENVFYTNRDKLSSVGVLDPGVSVRVVDPVTRVPLGNDKWGELLVKTPGMMLGYFRDQLNTSKAFNSKGYFKTGDIAQYDSDSYLYLRGRASDDIRVDNTVFSSSEIENVIKHHPAVAEVAVFPTNNEIVACIVKKSGHDLNSGTLMEYLGDILPPHKQPTKINFYEFFPKTLKGEVKKYILKENVIKLIREESFYHSEHVED